MKQIDMVLKSLEPFLDKIEKLPKAQRIMIFVGVFVFLLGSAYYFLFGPKFTKIEVLTQEKGEVERKLFSAKRNARQKETYRKKYKEAQDQFKIAKRALPGKKEIPSLLESISASGQDSGLEFNLFQPGGEINRDFYAEIPVSIQLSGGYHNLALFFDKISRLSRIVNIKNIRISPLKAGKLTTSCTALTYRFVEAIALR